MMPEGAPTSFTVCHAYRYTLSVQHSYLHHKVGHTVTHKIFNTNGLYYSA